MTDSAAATLHSLTRWPHFPASSIEAGQDARVFIREHAAEWAKEDGYVNA